MSGFGSHHDPSCGQCEWAAKALEDTRELYVTQRSIRERLAADLHDAREEITFLESVRIPRLRFERDELRDRVLALLDEADAK